MRLPFPRHSEGAAGKNLQAPRVSAKERIGCRDSGQKLDDLFVVDETRIRVDEESQVPAGLRSVKPDIRARSSRISASAANVLRAPAAIFAGIKTKR
jgi:hypothetical protein